MVTRDFLLVSAAHAADYQLTPPFHCIPRSPTPLLHAHMAGNGGSFNNGYSHYDQSVAAWSSHFRWH